MKRGFQRGLGTAFAALCIFVFAVTSFADEPRTATLVYLDYTDSAQTYRTNLLVACDDGDGCEVSSTTCNFGWFPTNIKLAKGESRIVDDFARGAFCSAAPLAIGTVTLPIRKGNPRISTVVTRTSKDGNVASFEVQPVDVAPPGNSWLAARLIQSDGNFSTWYAIFNESDRQVFVTTKVYDENNALAGSEVAALQPGFNWFEIKTRVRSGRVEIRTGTQGFGMPGSDATAPLRGVALVNWRAGGSPRVEPLRGFAIAPAP